LNYPNRSVGFVRWQKPNLLDRAVAFFSACR